MMGLLAKHKPDCIVAELGASPLEPYCGIEALREILGSDKRPSRVFVVLCASDAYSVSGLRQALVFWCEAITLCIWNHLSFRCSIIVMSVCGGCGPNAVQAHASFVAEEQVSQHPTPRTSHMVVCIRKPSLCI